MKSKTHYTVAADTVANSIKNCYCNQLQLPVATYGIFV